MRHNISLLLLSSLLLFSCGKSKEQPEKEKDRSMPFSTTVVSVGDHELQTAVPARLEGREKVNVFPQIEGRIGKVCFSEGDHVYKGQMLFMLDQGDHQSALDKAMKAHQAATEKLVQVKESILGTKSEPKEGEEPKPAVDLSSHPSYTKALDEYLKTKEALNEVKAEMAKTLVNAPIGGVTGTINHRSGEQVAPSMQEALVTISDDSYIYAYFDITDQQARDLSRKYGSLQEFVAQSTPVNMRLNNGDAYPEQGKIDAAYGIKQGKEGSVKVRAGFPNPARTLKNGGAAQVVLPQVMQKALVVPRSVTYSIQKDVFVYKVVNGRAQSQKIEVTSANNGTMYIVSNGLQPGDEIVSGGNGFVKDGAVIKPVK